MVGQIIQSKFLTEADYPQAAALSVILMLGMLVIALIYARVLGTEDATLAAGAALSAVTVDPQAPPERGPAPLADEAPPLDALHPAGVHRSR